jgi:hypothetical protein
MKKRAGKKVKDLTVKKAQSRGIKGGKLLEAAVKGEVFKSVEIHGTA